jgi:hypothetical protein
MQAHGKPLPTSDEFQVDGGFSCETRLPQVTGETFGSRFEGFPSKKSARKHAAWKAVLWLRENEALPLPRNSTPNKSAIDRSTDDSPPLPEDEHAQEIATLCAQLRLNAPRYEFTSPLQGFYSGGAYFDMHPSIPRPAGEVRNIFGKRKARRECMVALAEYLRTLEASTDQ